MFRAVEHQLAFLRYPRQWSYLDLRVQVADYLLAHKSDFEPFFKAYAENDATFSGAQGNTESFFAH